MSSSAGVRLRLPGAGAVVEEIVFGEGLVTRLIVHVRAAAGDPKSKNRRGAEKIERAAEGCVSRRSLGGFDRGFHGFRG